MTVNRSEIVSTIIFGTVDAVGLDIGLLLAAIGVPTGTLARTIAAGALAEAVGMAAASWLAGDTATGGPEALAMGVTVAAAALLPILPFALLSRLWAMLTAVLLLIAVAGAVTVARGRLTSNPRRALVETGIALAAVTAACALLAVV
jgi:VIT1/CCC1 family predicted Fe2+/Mn2+ transporter